MRLLPLATLRRDREQKRGKRRPAAFQNGSVQTGNVSPNIALAIFRILANSKFLVSICQELTYSVQYLRESKKKPACGQPSSYPYLSKHNHQGRSFGVMSPSL